MSHACHHFLENPQNPHVLLTLDKVHNPLRLPRETTSERPKVLRTSQFFALLAWKRASRQHCVFCAFSLGHVLHTVLTWKCALHHNGVHFFDISTSKWSEHQVLCILVWK